MDDKTNDALLLCSEFLCPKHFKCPETYCVPWHVVCDGVTDCPDGEDELGCRNPIPCPGMLRCIEENLCVEHNQVCDKVIDCKVSKDDEMGCFNYKCPISCNCLAYTAICNDQFLYKFPAVT